MAETADYDPGEWAGHDFKSARAVYDVHVGRSYAAAASAHVTAAELLLAKVSAKCKRPLIIVVDVTGSMGSWPATIFSKLPYLDKEGKVYLGEDMEICFIAVGDATTDQYPFQVRPFSKGLDLEVQLKKLVIEGGGGGQTTESYELAALYLAHNFEAPNAEGNPIIVFIGDEQPYSMISKAIAEKYAGVKLGESISTEAVFEKLKDSLDKDPSNFAVGTREYRKDLDNRFFQIWDAWPEFENKKIPY